MPRSLSALPLLLFLLAPIARADRASLPGCEAPSAIRRIVKDQLNSPEFKRLAYDAQIERKRQVLSNLMERYPREIEPYSLWIAAAREDQLIHPELLAGLQKEYREHASAHPDDPLALYVAGHALIGTDTPKSIGLLEKAQSLAPGFAWPSLDLAQIYSSGKFADKAKFEEQLTNFWTACPATQNRQARWMLVKNLELQTKVAAKLRSMLEKSTDTDRLKDYSFLWSLEFRTSSPQKFPELRRQVSVDLKRLETLNKHPDAEWAAMLIDGSRQVEAPADAIRQKEDTLIAQYPHSTQAERIVGKRWDKDHPAPTDQKDLPAWTAQHEALWAFSQKMMRQFPDSYWPPAYYRLVFIPFEDETSEPQTVEMVRQAVHDIEMYLQPSMRIYGYQNAADNLLDSHFAPQLGLEYLQQAKRWNDRDEAQDRAEDNHSDADRREHAKYALSMQRNLNGDLLRAAMRASRPDAVTAIKSEVEAPLAADDKDTTGYWLNRARLATVEGHSQDALTYYQLALRTRPKPPDYFQGKLTDETSDEAHALWTRLGGTEMAWTTWSTPATPANPAKADEARWEKPSQNLPDFKLADLSGKTWTVQSLNGKVVLINLWATWCGPCNAELPQLQKLYEQAKGRSDLQILTFNIDEDLGLVEPFMKEKGYTFPVVPAYSYVVNLLNGYAIPQNWVLSPKGQWDWTQVGYGSDDSWVKDMLAKLDAVKAGS